jgi:hypothetical protein
VRRALINVKIGMQILLDVGFSANVLVSKSMAAAMNQAMTKFNVS